MLWHWWRAEPAPARPFWGGSSWEPADSGGYSFPHGASDQYAVTGSGAASPSTTRGAGSPAPDMWSPAGRAFGIRSATTTSPNNATPSGLNAATNLPLAHIGPTVDPTLPAAPVLPMAPMVFDLAACPTDFLLDEARRRLLARRRGDRRVLVVGPPGSGRGAMAALLRSDCCLQVHALASRSSFLLVILFCFRRLYLYLCMRSCT